MNILLQFLDLIYSLSLLIEFRHHHRRRYFHRIPGNLARKLINIYFIFKIAHKTHINPLFVLVHIAFKNWNEVCWHFDSDGFRCFSAVVNRIPCLRHPCMLQFVLIVIGEQFAANECHNLDEQILFSARNFNFSLWHNLSWWTASAIECRQLMLFEVVFGPQKLSNSGSQSGRIVDEGKRWGQQSLNQSFEGSFFASNFNVLE